MVPTRHLTDLATVPERTVIINCGTKWVSTLAVVAAATNAGSPIVLIDCDSRDGSRDHFEQLRRFLPRDLAWLEWPLRPHGDALDQFFSEIRADTVLLIDSDLEIRSQRLVPAMRRALRADPRAYGAGFLQGPRWIGREHELHERAGWYAERMWIPCVLLRTSYVRRALRRGGSFAGRRTFHDFPASPRLSRLAALRYKLPLLRKSPPPGGSNGGSASFIEYDTGADLHALLQQQEHAFAPVAHALWADVRHYDGVTRAALTSKFVRLLRWIRRDRERISTDQRSVLAEVTERLSAVYGLPIDRIGGERVAD